MDYPEDLDFARALFAALSPEARIFTLEEMVTWMKSEEGRSAMPKHLARNADYISKKAAHSIPRDGVTPT